MLPLTVYVNEMTGARTTLQHNRKLQRFKNGFKKLKFSCSGELLISEKDYPILFHRNVIRQCFSKIDPSQDRQDLKKDFENG